MTIKLNKDSNVTILAVPKGRILEELTPMLDVCGIVPEDDFFSSKSRKLQFKTNRQDLEIIRVRAFDVATFVAYGAADIGVVGNDALEEFDYSELYSPIDLKIGGCRLSVACHNDDLDDIKSEGKSHIRIVTKYPNITKRYYGKLGVQAECIKLNGAMEIAPSLGLARRIVDLVSTGSTLKANNLTELETILNVSSRLIVNRSSQKTRPAAINEWVNAFRRAVE
ncbi:MAG: ATP phosphoribosyltransferase [Micavibrio sp.]|nr:ATP phosphoribosyltransferase [Micavibrio sp.]|tara:strand:+ start:2364 stop:3035 length:672 start_codon:yes stop_codon:yes gene_type:complete